jgi:site-specific recombinase XerD
MQEKNVEIEEITMHEIQQYILHLKNEIGLAPSTINNYRTAIKFLYSHILKREWDDVVVPRMKTQATFPVVLSREKVQLIIDSVTNIKHKAMLSLLYGSGLRVSEVAALRIRDINSENMTVRVENAKHGTNRYTILSEATLKTLRKYFVACLKGNSCKPDDWLFNGIKPTEHINVRSIKNTFTKLGKKQQMDDRVSCHTLRRCFASHLMEDGVDIGIIMQLLGHKSIKTTSRYLYMTSKSLMGIKSPLDDRDTN